MPLNIFNDHALTCADVMSNEMSFRAIQAYGLVSHGKQNVWLGLLRFQAPDTERPKLRTFLSAFGSRTTNAFDLWLGQQRYLTIRRSEADPAKRRTFKAAITPPLVTALGLSASSYRIFPSAVTPRFQSFQNGFRNRFPKLPLNELGDPFDAVLVLAADDPLNQLEDARNTIDSELQDLASVQWELGRVNKNDGVTREPFGFADGISQPAIFESDDNPGAIYWKPFAPLAAILTGEPNSSPPDDEYGSLMAFMKIEQDVAGFETLMRQMAAATHRSEDEVRSWMVGRTVDGVPLMVIGSGDNDFVYDSDPTYQVCPAAAHIRKANPRNEDARGVRIVRRGVPYDDGGGVKGLLFQGFAAKLESTFEFIMNTWLLNDEFPPNAPSPGMDPILGSRTASPLPVNIGARDSPSIRLVVSIKAGEYFYFPSIPFFNRLNG